MCISVHLNHPHPRHQCLPLHHRYHLSVACNHLRRCLIRSCLGTKISTGVLITSPKMPGGAVELLQRGAGVDVFALGNTQGIWPVCPVCRPSSTAHYPSVGPVLAARPSNTTCRCKRALAAIRILYSDSEFLQLQLTRLPRCCRKFTSNLIGTPLGRNDGGDGMRQREKGSFL